MTKQQLIELVQNVHLEENIQGLLFAFIESVPELKAEHVDAIADILQYQADFYDATADLFDAQAEECENLAANMQTLNAQEQTDKLAALKTYQDNLVAQMTKKLFELKAKV